MAGIPGQGRGRPQGAITRISREMIAREMAKGELPHQFLMRVVRAEDEFIVSEVENQDGTRHIYKRRPVLDERIEAAKAASPYFAPRLSESKVKASGTIGIGDLKDILTPEMKERAAKEFLKELNYQFDE